MSHVAVIPSIYQPWTDRCLRGCQLDTFVVDNTAENRGVAASWNLGIDEMTRRGGVDLGGAVVDNETLSAYYRRKWGGDKGAETFTRPFGNKPIHYWPPA